MFKNIPTRTKIIFGILATAFLGVIIYSIVTLILRAGKVAVTVKYAPYSATITLDGEPIKNNATHYLEPKPYSVTVENEHFVSQSGTVQITEEDHYIVGVLVASDEEGRLITEDRSREFQEAEGLVGQLANAYGQKRQEMYPILKYLPVNKTIYSLSYQTEVDDSPTVYIKAESAYIDTAIKQLYSLDNSISIASYKVLIRNYANPWEGAAFTNNTESNPVNFIKKGYDTNLDGYTATLAAEQDGYAGIIIQKPAPEGGPFYNTYRIALRKEGNAWKKLNDPYPILSQANASEVPSQLLDQINQK